MMRTVTVNQEKGLITNGWHKVKICHAECGTWTDKYYIDIWFEGFPDWLNLRVWETFNKETGEEFAIGNLFRFANAGIQKVIDGSGYSKTVRIDDDPAQLIGCSLQILIYIGDSGYLRICNRFAPSEPFVNAIDSMLENQINYYRHKAEDFLKQINPTLDESVPF